MNWEYIGIKTGRFFLALLEYTFKGLALLAAGISLGTVSGFEQKFSAGFTSLTSGIRNAFEVPSELIYQASVINDYNSMSASFSTEAYNTANVDTVFAYFGGVLDYFSRVGESLSSHFFASISAAVLLFGIFYLLAWVLRFARQKGQGTWKVQLERRLAEKVFKIPVELAQAPQSQPIPEPKRKSSKLSKFTSRFKRKLTSNPKPKMNTNGNGLTENGQKLKVNGMKKNGVHSKSNPELESDIETDIDENFKNKEKLEESRSTSKLRSVSRSIDNVEESSGTDYKDKESSPEGNKHNKKEKKSTPPPPPPKRNEPDWLTNARKSTKEYRQAIASNS